MELKKLFSYLWPFTLKKYHSKISGEISLHLMNGHRTLDTEKSNYSFGSLQKILKEGLVAIKFDDSIKSILVLGLGAGSIVETVRKDFQSNAMMTLVELDPTMIQIAENDFGIHEFKNLSIQLADANDYVKTSQQKFDLIIIDLFIIDTIPEIFTQQPFISNVVKLLNQHGQIIYNTMRSTMTDAVFTNIKDFFSEEKMKLRILEKVQWSNDLLIAQKIEE